MNTTPNIEQVSDMNKEPSDLLKRCAQLSQAKRLNLAWQILNNDDQKEAENGENLSSLISMIYATSLLAQQLFRGIKVREGRLDDSRQSELLLVKNIRNMPKLLKSQYIRRKNKGGVVHIGLGREDEDHSNFLGDVRCVAERNIDIAIKSDIYPVVESLGKIKSPKFYSRFTNDTGFGGENKLIFEVEFIRDSWNQTAFCFMRDGTGYVRVYGSYFPSNIKFTWQESEISLIIPKIYDKNTELEDLEKRKELESARKIMSSPSLLRAIRKLFDSLETEQKSDL